MKLRLFSKKPMAKKLQTITKTKINPKVLAGVIILVGLIGLSFIGTSLLSTGVTLVNSNTNVNDNSKPKIDLCKAHNGTNDLIAWYKLDSAVDNVTQDYSGNNFGGIASGTPAFAPGIPGQGCQFDGINDYIALTFKYCGGKHLINGLTTCAWFSTTEKTGVNFDNWAFIDFDRTQYFSFFVTPTGKIGFSTHSASNNNSTNDFYSTVNEEAPALNDGQVHFACAVYNQGTKLIYIDGKKNAQTYAHAGKPLEGTADRCGFIGDGSQATGADGLRYNKYFKGMINEVRLYEKALSEDDVRSLYKEVMIPTLDPSGQVNNKCSVSPIDSAQCYTAIDSACTSQTIKPKDSCIETFINIYLGDDAAANNVAALDPEGIGAPWPPLGDDLIVKYCISNLNYTRANRPLCKKNLGGLDSSIFEITSNVTLINSALANLGLGGAKSGGACSYSSCNDCKSLGTALAQAAASCSSGGSCPSDKVKSNCSGDKYVLCTFDGGWSESMKLSDCQAKNPIIYCPITPTCPSTEKCDCNWLDPTYIKASRFSCAPIFKKENTQCGAANVAGSDELVCKLGYALCFLPSGMSLASGAHAGGNAVDIYVSGTTAQDKIHLGRQFLYNIGPSVTTEFFKKLRALSELMPCEIKGLGAITPAERVPMVHLDVRQNRGCVFYNVTSKTNPAAWAGKCVEGSYPELFYKFPPQSQIDAEIKSCGNYY